VLDQGERSAARRGEGVDGGELHDVVGFLRLRREAAAVGDRQGDAGKTVGIAAERGERAARDVDDQRVDLHRADRIDAEEARGEDVAARAGADH
jgi:hypothetical protein